MKNYLLLAAVLLCLSACNQAELDKVNHERDSLLAVVNGRDSSINDYITAFNEVEANLDAVAIKQQLITTSTDKKSELGADQRSRINAEIEAINNLMDQNRQKIEELTKKLKSSNNKNALLEKTITMLKNQLAQKDTELAALNEKLNALNTQVAQLQTNVNTLSAENAAQSQSIAEKTAALHTAYYVVGKSKALQEAKIIDKSGGLLGMGKTPKLSANVDNSKFTKIDNTQVTSIPVNGKKVKIITSHPSDSYKLEPDAKDKDLVKELTITNAEKFWSASKYLVIVKD